MLGVKQTILCCLNGLKEYDLDYLAYQMLKKHTENEIINMNDDTVKRELEKIIQ